MRQPIFIALGGPEIQQNELVRQIAEGYECWNLKRINLPDFVQAIQSRIPPVNDGIRSRHYELQVESKEIYGITQKEFGTCSWGLFIPDAPEGDETTINGYGEIRFLMNLYSPEFLYPVFFASNTGINRHPSGKHSMAYFHNQNQAHLFCTTKFVEFFKLLLPQGQYGVWQLYRSQKWRPEDWRLFVAALLFTGLKDYDNAKSSFGWQREAADMASILEALFTAGDKSNEEVGYRLRKRVAVLLSDRLSSIEEDVKELYEQRSAFVHGSFFAKIAKESKKAFNNLPVPDYKLLTTHKKYARWALVAYLHLAHVMKSQPGRFGQFPNVMTMLEVAIINVRLRADMLTEANKILDLMAQ